MKASTVLMIMGFLLPMATFFLGATIQHFKSWPWRK